MESDDRNQRGGKKGRKRGLPNDDDPSHRSRKTKAVLPCSTVESQNNDAGRRFDSKKSGCSQSRKMPLSGCIIAVSSLMESATTEGGTSTSTPAESYSCLIQLCQEAGAQTTAQVHKKVLCVVASKAAVEGETQRVRKARKKGVPIVSPDWVRHCIESETRIDWRDFIWKQQQHERSRMFNLSTDAKSVDASKDQKAANDLKAAGPKCADEIALGCCCVCHENGDTNCPWCTDCSVAKAAKT